MGILTWTATAFADNRLIEIAQISDGVVYRRSTYAMETLVCTWWVEGIYQNAAIYQDEDKLIEVTNDPARVSYGNSILGLTVPSEIVPAWDLLTAGTSTTGGSGSGTTSSVPNVDVPLSSVRTVCTEIKNSIDTSRTAAHQDNIDVQLTNTAVLTAVEQVASNTTNVNYDFQLAQDATGVVFVVRYNKGTGVTSNFTLAGLNYTPVGNVSIESSKFLTGSTFEAKTNNAPNWGIGDHLRRLQVFNAATNTLTPIWFNDFTGSILSASPTIGSDCEPIEKLNLSLFRSLQAQIGNLGSSTATADNGNFNLLQYFSRLLSKIPALGQASLTNSLPVVIAPDQTPLPVNIDPATLIFDLPNSTIASSTTTSAFIPSMGISYQVDVVVVAISVNTVYQIDVQESPDNGTNWRTVYRFPVIDITSGIGVYKSPMLPQTGHQIRYVQTVTGAAASVTRSILRSQSNQSINLAIGTKSISVFNVANNTINVQLLGRVRRLSAGNRTASALFLQVHSTTNLTNGAVPKETYQVAANNTLVFTVADLGEHGSVLGGSLLNSSSGVATTPRVAFSTTYATYTAPTSLAANTIHLFAEVL